MVSYVNFILVIFIVGFGITMYDTYLFVKYYLQHYK